MIWTPRAKRCSKKTCVRLARKKSRCFVRSPKRSPKAPIALSFWTPHRRATRFCCSIPALAYHREVSRQANQIPESVENLLPRLRDPNFTRVLVVTLPEATPVHEAAKLQEDLRRAEIEPFAWVINQSLVPLEVTDPTLRRRQQHELPFIDEVKSQLARRVALIPWQVDPPTGVDGLRRITQLDSSVA